MQFSFPIPSMKARNFAFAGRWLAALALMVGAVASAAPIALSQFERDKKMIDEQVEALVNAEFANEIAGVENLSKPLAVGDEVSVEMRRGGAVETVTGRFNGIVGQYVRISSNSILLTDVGEFQRARFTIAQYPDRRDAIVNENRANLSAALERRRRQLRPSILRDAGYGPDFFTENVRLGQTIYQAPLLGDNQVFAVLQAVEGDELVTCRLINKANLPATAVLTLNGSGIGGSGSAESPTARWIDPFDVSLPRSSITSLPHLTRGLRIVCNAEPMGIWALQASPETKRKTTSVMRDGTSRRAHQILISFQLAGVEKGDAMTLALATVPEVPAADYKRHFGEGILYQQQMAALKQEIAAREAAAKEALALQQAAALAAQKKPDPVDAPKASALNNAALAPLLAAAKEADHEVAPFAGDAASKADDLSNRKDVANHLAPATVGDAAIAGGTPWIRLQPTYPEGSKTIDFPEYRFLPGTRGETPVLFLQLTGLFSTNSAAVETYTVNVASKSEPPIQSQIKFTSPIDWVGKLFLYAEIPPDVLTLPGHPDLSLDIQRDKP